MKIGAFTDFFEVALKANRRVLAVSKSGIGKTQGKAQACARAGFDFIDLCSAIEDPSTIRGYPARENGKATHCMFDGIYKAFHAEKPTCLNFGDLGQATEATMKSIMRLVQFGEIDGKRLPDHVVIAGDTNDVGHGAGVVGMIEPLKQRFHTIVTVETDLDDVIGYGLAKGWPSDLLAFLRNAPDALHDWKPSKNMHVDGACPRGWEYAAEWVNLGVEDQEVIAGCVGKGRAAQYLAFRALIGELPDVDACLMNPDVAPVPSNPSAQWLVSMALASKLTSGNFGRAMTYLARLPAMFRAFSVRDAFRSEAEKRKQQALGKDYRPLSSSSDFTAWACSSDGKAVMDAAS